LPTAAPPETTETEPGAVPQTGRLRGVQAYAGLIVAVIVTIAWIALLLVLAWRIGVVAYDLVS
jgi:uncharacterized RDD family membrane protein YckC